MANRGRSSLLWVTLAMFALLLAGCSGFFVDPTLTSISVVPATASISPCPAPPGTVCTQQLTATGTFNDGSTGPVTVTWTSNDSAVASVSTGGLVTGVSVGSATISASSGSVTPGTSSITVCGTNTSTISITPTSASAALATTTPPSFRATGSNGQDITTQVTWHSSDTTVATIGPSTGLTTLLKVGTTTITATACSVTSNAATLTVTS